ncbi:MAG: helix-turn-helix transcriptional regulator [Geobacter sp.]|nr:MAG: helix-turn-helix transcriptional regulator [Geobacter sp.]
MSVHKNTLGKYERGERVPDSEFLVNIIDVFPDIDPSWLLMGKGPKGEGVALIRSKTVDQGRADFDEDVAYGYVQVPRYEIAASAGGGAMVHSEQIVDHLAFKADWLKVSLGLSPRHVAVISVIGDSMEPYLDDGDLILVDLSVTHIENNAIYVLQFGDSLLVKRVQVKLDGEVIVKSDNPRYEPEAFHGDSAERLRVVGRMVRRLVR